MPDTFQALAVTVVALLPGALYVWSFERIVGSWGAGLSDRVLRFVGFSALFQLVFVPLAASSVREYVRSGEMAGRELPASIWLLAVAYVIVPMAAGTLVGWGTVKRSWWARLLAGPSPAPRAWDHLFGSRPDGWIRLRLRSGTWVAGAYSSGARSELGSYASGYPYDQDLFVRETVLVDPETGLFDLDDQGNARFGESSLLVRWDEVEYLEFIDA